MTPARPAANRERVLLLECRLEQMRSALDTAREEADRARMKVAEAAAREAEHARRYSLIHQELAEARADVATLHRHLDRSESLRAELAGHIFEGGSREDAAEFLRLRRRALAEDQRALVSERAVAHLRERVEELVASRETLLTRIAEWQQLVREDGPEAADLSEFLSELRRDIIELEHRNLTSDAREAVLREHLALAGIDPDRELAREREAAVQPDDEDESRVAQAPEVASAAESVAPDKAERSLDVAAEPSIEPIGPSIGAAEPPIEAAPVEPFVASAEADASERFVASAEADPSEPPGTSAEADASEPLGASAEADPSEPLGAAPARALDESKTPKAPAAPPRGRTGTLVAALDEASEPTVQADLLLQLGRSGDATAVEVVPPWTDSPEPFVRAAAYEALGRLLERSPSAVEPWLRKGIADPDARVRRRVALSAATVRGLATHTLLDPLREDADPQVRRVVRQVLRPPPPVGAEVHAGVDDGPRAASPGTTAEPEPRGARPPTHVAFRPSRSVR